MAIESVKTIMESNSYQEQKKSVVKFFNNPLEIDYTIFEKTPEERTQLHTMKEENKQIRRQKYGDDYKRHLN